MKPTDLLLAPPMCEFVYAAIWLGNAWFLWPPM